MTNRSQQGTHNTHGLQLLQNLYLCTLSRNNITVEFQILFTLINICSKRNLQYRFWYSHWVPAVHQFSERTGGTLVYTAYTGGPHGPWAWPRWQQPITGSLRNCSRSSTGPLPVLWHLYKPGINHTQCSSYPPDELRTSQRNALWNFACAFTIRSPTGGPTLVTRTASTNTAITCEIAGYKS